MRRVPIYSVPGSGTRFVANLIVENGFKDGSQHIDRQTTAPPAGHTPAVLVLRHPVRTMATNELAEREVSLDDHRAVARIASHPAVQPFRVDIEERARPAELQTLAGHLGAARLGCDWRINPAHKGKPASRGMLKRIARRLECEPDLVGFYESVGYDINDWSSASAGRATNETDTSADDDPGIIHP